MASGKQPVPTAVSAELPPISGDPILVLHIDDDPSMSDLVHDFLVEESDVIDVVSETNARVGLDRLEDDAERIDCIVSDYQMPKLDGIEFLRAVRADYPEIPFILFTGKGSEEVASEAISAGVTDYLQKETGTEQYVVLANRIENVVARHRAEQDVRRGFQAMETAREGISLLNREGRFTYVNQAYVDIVGYDREELLGKHWQCLYRPEDVEVVRKEILPSVPTEGRWTGQNVYVRSDGGEVTVDHALSYCDDETLVCLIQETSPQFASG